MDIEELRAAQTRERTTDGLQELRDSFYREVAEYIADLRERRQTVADEADDPFGNGEVQSLTDEIETAEQVAEAIYERRMGKIVKQASLAAAGMGSEAQGLTTEERALYTDLVSRIEENKSRVLDVLAGEADASTSSGPDARAPPETDETPEPADVVNDRDTDGVPTPPPDEPLSDEGAGDGAADAPSDDARSSGGESSAAAAMGGGDFADGERGNEAAAEANAAAKTEASAEGGAETAGEGDAADENADGEGDADAASERAVERDTVRITRDVGEILGVDERAYTLEADDVVTLPTENAEPLLARDAAEKLD